MFLYNMQWTVREDSPLRYQHILWISFGMERGVC